MANVYSARLFSSSTLVSGTTDLPAVPAGFVWVVRDVEWQNGTGQWWQGLNGAMLIMPDNSVFATTPHPATTTTNYQWQGHVVLNAGEVLRAFTHDSGWCVIGTGYQLTLP